MSAYRYLTGLYVFLGPVLFLSEGKAVDLDVEATASGGSTRNLFSDSSRQNDTYSSSSVDVNWFPRSFARVNLIGEYTYYGNFFNLSNLVYGGGLTLIPTSDSSRFSTYFEANVKKREYRNSDADSSALNANEISGDDYDGKVGVGYSLSARTQLRFGATFKSTQYQIDGVIDRERIDLATGVNTTLIGSVAFDLELGYSTGKYQYVNPWQFIAGIPEYGIPDTVVSRRAIKSGEQYSILLIDRLESWYLSPRLSRSLGMKTGLALTYSYRKFVDLEDKAVVYGYSSGYLSPWLGEYAGQAAVMRVKTYLIPRLTTTVSVGFWEREHLPTVEREYRLSGIDYGWTVNLLYAQERTDWRRRVDISLQIPLHLSEGVTLEPSLQADYTDNNSTVAVYDYHDFALSGGITVRF